MAKKKLYWKPSDLRCSCRIRYKLRLLWTLSYRDFIGENATYRLIEQLIVLQPLILQGRGVYLEYGETLYAKDGQQAFRPRPNWRYGQHQSDSGDAKASACKG